MAIQAQLYSENFGLGFGGGAQDMLMEFDDNLCFSQLDHQFQDHQKNLEFSVENNNNNIIDNNNNNNIIIDNNNMHFLSKNDMNDHHLQQQQQQSTPLSRSVSAHIEKQRLEFEQFINLQNERLRLAIHHQSKRQISLLLKSYESKTQFLLSQKQEEITRASNRTIELQDFLKKLEIENATWQKLARDNEATVASLNGTIRRLREPAAAAADDAESCCQLDGLAGAKNEYATGNCKRCDRRRACVVMLPCRHMCSCGECEGFLEACPVCRMVKKGSIEALI